MEISISLDPAVGKNIEEYIKQINEFEDTSVHCDVMRPPFVERTAIDLTQYEYLMTNARHDVDVHLMVSDGSITEILNASRAILPRSITFHVEAIPAAFLAYALIGGIKQQGIKAGLAIDLDTPIDIIDQNLFRVCDTITIMSVKAGASGQKFNTKALDKVKAVKAIAPDARIIMDGGINSENIATVKAAGVHTAVVGSFIYNSQDKKEALELLQTLSS